MAETWEQTKARLKKQGVKLSADIVVPKERYAPEKKEPIKKYNIHKRSLPVGIDKVVVLNVSKQEAERWIENKLKARCYENAPDDSKTLIYFDIIPVDATPRERSIYFNTKQLTIDENLY